jgi:hypothetical protein
MKDKENPQLTISVTHQLLEDVQRFEKVFGGSLYSDSSHKGYYQ